METPKRFTEAVTKLYNAFHRGKLNAFDCAACAVGSVVGSSAWKKNWYTNTLGGMLAQRIKGTYPVYEVIKTGYSVEELAKLELIFLQNFDLSLDRNGQDKEQQFNGLCAVIEYLCELDGIPNVMDYTCLFETESDKPKYELSF